MNAKMVLKFSFGLEGSQDISKRNIYRAGHPIN